MSDLVTNGCVGYEAFGMFLHYVYTWKLSPSPAEVSTCTDKSCVHYTCRPVIDYAVELMSSLTRFRPRSKLSVASTPQMISSPVWRLLARMRKKSSKSIEPWTQDDVALVELLLKESDVTLDDVNALHYAAVYSEPKVFKDVLGLGRANVNLKDSRGCSVLHVAALRKSPSILVALLDKGASIMECTPDGQTAVVICRRSTRWKDYNQNTIQGQESNKDRMCIDVLEEQMQRILTSGYNWISSNLRYEEQHMQLDYLEGRGRCAALLFAAEAKVAMEIDDADWTPLYRGLASKESMRYFRPVDIDEDHSLDAERLKEKLLTLCKTVEMGRRYFLHCLEVLHKFLVEIPDEMKLEQGTEEEQRYKVKYMELKEEVQEAINKNMTQSKRPSPSSSAAWLLLSKDRLTKKVKKKK